MSHLKTLSLAFCSPPWDTEGRPQEVSPEPSLLLAAKFDAHHEMLHQDKAVECLEPQQNNF